MPLESVDMQLAKSEGGGTKSPEFSNEGQCWKTVVFPPPSGWIVINMVRFIYFFFIFKHIHFEKKIEGIKGSWNENRFFRCLASLPSLHVLPLPCLPPYPLFSDQREVSHIKVRNAPQNGFTSERHLLCCKLDI